MLDNTSWSYLFSHQPRLSTFSRKKWITKKKKKGIQDGIKNNFSFGSMACGILVPQPGIKPVPLAMEAQSLNHWTTREVPEIKILKCEQGKQN